MDVGLVARSPPRGLPRAPGSVIVTQKPTHYPRVRHLDGSVALRYPRAPMGQLGAEARAAVALLTVLDGTRDAPTGTLAGALAFFPLVGLGEGLLAAAIGAATARAAPALAGPIAVAVLAVVAGGAPSRALAHAVAAAGRPRFAGAAVAVLALAVKLVAVARLPAAARTAAVVLAPMLGAWAMVVQCYGGPPGEGPDPAARLVGRARFREFGAASLGAFAVTLAIGDAVGLLVLVCAALVTLGIRVTAHGGRGGLAGLHLGATRELVETVVMAVLGVLAQLKT